MGKKDGNKVITLFKWIWQSYLKTALIPLVLVELVFVVIYFMSNSWFQAEIISYLRQETSKEFSQIAKQESNIIQQQIASVSNAVEMYRIQTERALSSEVSIDKEDAERLSYSSEGVYYTNKDRSDGGAAVFYSGIIPVGEKEKTKVKKLLKTQYLMKDIIKSQPLAASMYFNTFDSLNVIYPYFEVLSQYPPLMNIPTYNFYYEADKNHNPEGKVKWTDSYLDPAGHGWMASAIAPVYTGDFLEGVVGIDVTVSTIASQILKLEVPLDGYGVLVGKDGTILALPGKGEKDWGLTELTEHHYDEAIKKDTFKPDEFNIYKRNGLEDFTKEISGNTEGFSNMSLSNKTQAVSWATVADTEWKLLIVVPEENIYAKVNDIRDKLFIIGALMIAGLVFFYSIFFYILAKKAHTMSSNISQPLLDINNIVERIGEGQYYQKEPEFYVKELNDTASNLINMGQQLGNSNNALLETQSQLKKRETDLQALVNSIDDIIIKLDENGYFIDIWAKDKENLSKEFVSGAGSSIEAIMDKETAAMAKTKIKHAIENNSVEVMEYLLETNRGFRWFQARISLIDKETRNLVIAAQDITQRKEMEASIIMAKEEAEKASMAKSQFLSSMSHELRTPLNAIIGFSQVLEMDTESPLSEVQGQSVKEVLKAGNHLLELINEVLDLSKIESGKMSLSIEPVQVNLIMEETVSLIQPFADKNGIKIIYKSQDNLEDYVLADKTRIKQVLINLLSNAVKYNKEKGQVTYYYEKLDNSIRFNVTDTGCGIAKEDFKEIFKPFRRLNTMSNTIEGTGIGLTVAKQLTELMNGEIHVESITGEGSDFYVEIPIAKVKHTLDGLSDDSSKTTEKSMDEVRIYKVLYVEDNPANLKLVERILTRIPSIEMFSSASGELSIDLARAHKPDIILLDINLPGIDGFEVFRRLRGYEETANIPIIAVSANAMEKDIEKGLDFGFKDYITKPINVSSFIEKISTVLKER